MNLKVELVETQDCSEGYANVTFDSSDTVMPDGSMDKNHNWIVAAYKSPSPDNMCEPFTVYLWAMHWSVIAVYIHFDRRDRQLERVFFLSSHKSEWN